MLSQQNRLKRAEEIASVFKQGQGFHSAFFSAKFTPITPNKPTRLAFSFGKKYLTRAVLRNRLKRRIIGELEKTPDFFLIGRDIVFFLAKPGRLEPKKEFQECVESFLKTVYPV